MLVKKETDTSRLAFTNAFYLTMWDLDGFFKPTTSSFIIDFAGITTEMIASTALALIVLALILKLWREKQDIQDDR